jgi:hypothetical protein
LSWTQAMIQSGSSSTLSIDIFFIFFVLQRMPRLHGYEVSTLAGSSTTTRSDSLTAIMT